MKHTTFTFIKDGQRYFSNAKNPIEARDAIELAFGIDLAGAIYEELYKLRVVRTGKVR